MLQDGKRQRHQRGRVIFYSLRCQYSRKIDDDKKVSVQDELKLHPTGKTTG